MTRLQAATSPSAMKPVPAPISAARQPGRMPATPMAKSRMREEKNSRRMASRSFRQVWRVNDRQHPPQEDLTV